MTPGPCSLTRLEALPTATGYEFGSRTRALPRTELFATYWFLDLASELVFVGDGRTTEAAAGRIVRDWKQERKSVCSTG